MTLSCFEKALAMATDDNMADVWYVKVIRRQDVLNHLCACLSTEQLNCTMVYRYNIGQVAIGIGDLNLAYQAFKVLCQAAFSFLMFVLPLLLLPNFLKFFFVELDWYQC